MTVQEFAENHRLNCRLDGCGDRIIPGRYGHIGDGYNDGKLGMFLSFQTIRKYNAVRGKLLAAGFVSRQNADTEGVLIFDAENREQARFAQRAAGIKTKRVYTPEQLAKMTERLKKQA